MSKKKVPLILSLSLLVGAVGCSSMPAAKQEQASANETNENITLKFLWWGSEARKESTLKVIELYKKENPHVQFQTEVVANTGAVATQLAIQTANQNTADIIQSDYNFIYNYINRDLIEPLDAYAADQTLNLSDIDKAYLAPGIKDDKLYVLPIGNNSSALLYDPELFQKAGVPVPKDEYTIDELYETMKQLKASVNSPDFYPLGNMFDIFYYLRARGAAMYNLDGSELGYTNDQLMTDYFALSKKWRDEGLVGSVSTANASSNKDHPIITGKTAFYSVSTNAVSSLSKLAGHPLKLLPYPKVPGGVEGNFIKPSMFLGISAYSEHKKEAAKFIDFFINNEAANDILNGERGIPVSGKIASRLSAKLDEAGKEQYRILDFLKTRSKPIDPPYPSNHVVIFKAYELALKQVSEGTLSPADGARQYREQVKTYLAGESGGGGK